jgi:hypothetical protein
MNDAHADLQTLGRRLVGRWTVEATHPAIPGTVVPGTADVEWLTGERFLILRTTADHPDFPDATWIVGDTAGLQVHYFDSRGVHRVYDVTVTAEGWTFAMGKDPTASAYASGHEPFAQRTTYTFSDGDRTMVCLTQMSTDDVTWVHDLEATYRRVS